MSKKKKAGESGAAKTGSFTDTQRVKELIDLMTDNGLTEIELVEDKSRIVLRRGTTTGGMAVSHAAAPAPERGHAGPSNVAAAAGGRAGAAAGAGDCCAASRAALPR